MVQGYSPLQAGLRTLPWTAMPIFIAPIAGILSDRIGARPLLVAGMALMAAGLAWIAIVSTPTVAYGRLVPAFVMAGVGMSLYFAPVANLVLGTVRRDEEGKASGVNNTVREVGGVFGVAVLASVFSAVGSYAHAAGVRERHGPGALGRRDGGGARRRRRDRDPAAPGRGARFRVAARAAPGPGRGRGGARARGRGVTRGAGLRSAA